MEMKNTLSLAGTIVILTFLGCGEGGSTDSSSSNTDISVCPGVSPASAAIVPESCDAVAEDTFFSEHFRLIVTSYADGSQGYTFDRSFLSAGLIEIEDYRYDTTLATYVAEPALTTLPSSHMIQNSSGEWVRLLSRPLLKGVLGAAVIGAEGNEYPVRIVSPDDPNFELLIHIKDIIEADISGIEYDKVRFSSLYTGGINDVYQPGAKAYSARLVLKEPVIDRYYSVSDPTVYASLQEFIGAYASQWFCLGNGYGVKFDSGSTQLSVVQASRVVDTCVPESGVLPLTVDFLIQTLNGVDFIVLPGESLAGYAYTGFGVTRSYMQLIRVNGNLVEMAYRLPAETTFDYRPGFGAYLNRVALNNMLTSFGKPEAP